MSIRLACAVFAVAISSSRSPAQYSTAVPSSVKTGATTAGGTPGGFLMGADDCDGPHVVVPSGAQSGVPFTTGTTGSEGQAETDCDAFGSTGLGNDVWFDWQATVTGYATMETCSGTSLDTRIAVYPLNDGSCPVDGTSLACNDDACGLQSRMTWPVVAGAHYTLQVGTSPGAAGGSGTFDLTQYDPPGCGDYDDGTSENAIGLTAGGEMGWLQPVYCLLSIDRIETAYGTPLIGPYPPAGSLSRVAIYDDTPCNGFPTRGLVLVRQEQRMCVNPGTDILNVHPLVPPITSIPFCAWIMATCEHAPGEFPGPMDMTNPTPDAWVVGQTTGAGGQLDLIDLDNNNVPIQRMQQLGFPTAWLLRAGGEEEGAVSFQAQCFGIDCPCGGNSTNTGGCDNSLAGTGGTILLGGGAADLSNDTLWLRVNSTPNQPGIFFQGDDFLVPPPSFGDGLRCCGTNLVRCGTYLPVGNTTSTLTGNQIGGNSPPISEIGPNVHLSPGDVRCYQWWYRDPAGGPCAAGFNLSNSIRVIWSA